MEKDTLLIQELIKVNKNKTNKGNNRKERDTLSINVLKTRLNRMV